jgi:endonuclease/exonuclease/phosphatase family metal-dependent hydrolase
MSYTFLRGRWCNIIVLNAHAPSEEKSDDSKDSFYEELEHFYDNFPQCHLKILLGDFNEKLRRQDNFKPTIGNENLHQGSNDNDVRIVSFATSNITVFPHRNTRKYNMPSLLGKTHRQIDHILIDRRPPSSTLDLHSLMMLTVILITIRWLQKLGKDWQ